MHNVRIVKDRVAITVHGRPLSYAMDVVEAKKLIAKLEKAVAKAVAKAEKHGE